MKVLKSAFMMLLSVLVIFIFSGCQKDEVTSKSKEMTKSEESADDSTSNQKEIDQTNQEEKAEIVKKENKETKQKAETIDTKKDSNEKIPKTAVVEKKQSSSSNVNRSTQEKKQTEPKTNTINEKTSSNENPSPTKKETAPQLTVMLSIVGDKQKGTIIPPTSVTITKGDTVLDVTRSILKQKGIQIDVRGNGATAYVQGIANLYEFDLGPLSGWTAKKNGTLLDRSVGTMSIDDGDTIQWIYTTDYSKDGGG